MKKITLLVALGLFSTSIAFVSCSKKKDWTCSCTFNGSNSPATAPITDTKKKKAEDACEAIETQANALIGGTSCTLTEK